MDLNKSVDPSKQHERKQQGKPPETEDESKNDVATPDQLTNVERHPEAPPPFDPENPAQTEQ